ncbi:hypothetical protein ACFL9U_17235 [Thermodesulfobacteriota bacterium]
MVNTMSPDDKPLIWMHGEITTPPFSANTPKSIIDICKQRIKRYEKDVKEWEK